MLSALTRLAKWNEKTAWQILCSAIWIRIGGSSPPTIRLMLSLIFISLLALLGAVPVALAQTPFYEGKHILLVSGTDAGGAGDLRTRAVIPVLKKHISGHPNIVVQYMPGAGGRKAANHMYKSVRPDGLTIGAMLTGMVQGTIFGRPTFSMNSISSFISAPMPAMRPMLFLRARPPDSTPGKN